MLRTILIVVLSLGVVGATAWGYQEHQEKNAILIQAENTYQRSFHELSYYMDLLHDKIGTSLAMNSRERLSPQLAEIWRLSSDAHSQVGQLPLSLMPFNKTEEFLSNIGDFTYRTAVRDLDKDPLTDKEVKTLNNLYQQAGEIKNELRQVQSIVLENNLRWMDVQLALANNEEQEDNTIVDGFQTVEKKVEGYSEANADSLTLGNTTKDHDYLFVNEKKIDEKQALKESQNIFNVNDQNNIDISKSGKGADVPIYSLSYKNNDKNAYMDMTQNGGHPINLLVDRPVNDQTISLNEGMEKAQAYLKKHDYKNMVIFQSSQYDSVGVYSFLYDDDGVRVYSDAIEVKVALDNGDIIGFTARDYLMNHQDRDIKQPVISNDEAKDKVNPNIQIMEEHLAVIDNDLGKEVLAHEFLGVMDDITYRIFINAENGIEEKVERLGGTESIF